MDAIAFIYEETFVYWNSIILTLAVGVATCIFLAVYLANGDHAIAAAVYVPMAITFSLVLARLAHWYCRADSYADFETALTDYTSGGFALMGAFAGCLLAACALRLVQVVKSLPKLLDALSLGGAAGIAVGRLACFFTTADRGMLMSETPRLPLAYPVINAVTGEAEYRLATFVLQSAAAGGIFAILLAWYLINRTYRKKPDGDVFLLFAMLYGASQIVLDSTRYDSLYLRSNGFISIVQILGAAGVVIPVVIFSVRLVRGKGWKAGYLIFWVLIAAALGVAGYMEYHVQRHGDQALFAYGVMSACLFAVILLALILRVLAVRPKGGKYKAVKA